jgi:hypothetical protein
MLSFFDELAFILFGEEISQTMTTPSGKGSKKCVCGGVLD